MADRTGLGDRNLVVAFRAVILFTLFQNFLTFEILFLDLFRWFIIHAFDSLLAGRLIYSGLNY
jgi:hypothetical protein